MKFREFLTKILSMKVYLLFILVLISSLNFAQNIISGKVVDSQNQPIKNANITLVDSYDGASSDENGEFQFETTEEGTWNLEIEADEFASQIISVEIPIQEDLFIVLENTTELATVTFGVGTMRAVGNTNETLMNSLDIVTTAGSDGDIIAAMQTLPGTSSNDNDGRLFIRGGESEESSIYINRLKVFQPYNKTAPNVPTRGRYSPQIFKGINFSTGGYDANFGQALSGILELETKDFPTENSFDLGFLTLGIAGAINKSWEKDALSTSLSYFNLQPTVKVLETRDDWKKAPENGTGEIIYRHQFNKGIYKSYFAGDFSRFRLNYTDINSPEGIDFELKNYDLYWNNSYLHQFNYKNQWFVGFSASHNKNEIAQNLENYETIENGFHFKTEYNWKLNSKNHFDFGSEYIFTSKENISVNDNLNTENLEDLMATYAQYTWYFARKWGLKTGIRFENSDYIKDWNISPRVSLAYKINEFNNLSAFWGKFYQSPIHEMGYENPQTYMQSEQWMLNYFYKKEKQIVRLEIYQKNYRDLVRYGQNAFETQDGTGFARGVDLFWRNRGSHIKNLEYWISYSFIDTKRLYKDFPEKAQPSFIANHNLSLVAKYWISSLRSQLGFTYQFQSGKPYTDLNSNEFLGRKTQIYNNVHLSWAYLIDQQKILYISFSNPLGFKNISGYNYAILPDETGFHAREIIRPALNRFFFVGFFWTISENKNRNQLDTL